MCSRWRPKRWPIRPLYYDLMFLLTFVILFVLFGQNLGLQPTSRPRQVLPTSRILPSSSEAGRHGPASVHVPKWALHVNADASLDVNIRVVRSKECGCERGSDAAINARQQQSMSKQRPQADLNCEWTRSMRRAIHMQDWEVALALARDLTSTVLPSGRNAVYVIAETCRRKGNLSMIVPLLNAIALNALTCSEDDLMPTLNACANRRDVEPDMLTAQRIFSLAEWWGLALSAKAYSVMLKGYGRQRNLAMVRLMMSKVAESRGRGGAHEKGILVPDVVLLNSAMDAFIECGAPEEAIRLLKQINGGSKSKSRGVERRKDTIKTAALGAGADQPSGENVFFESSVRPNTRSFNTLLKAFRGGHSDSLSRARSAVKFMKELGLQPDTITVNTLVDVAVQAGELSEATNILLEYLQIARATEEGAGADGEISSVAFPGVEAYTSLIAGYAGVGDTRRAFEILGLMVESGVPPNKHTLTSLMTSCVQTNDMVRARELLLLGTSDTDSKSGIKRADMAALHGVYITILSRLPHASGLDKAHTHIKYMRSIGLRPDVASLNAFVQSLFLATATSSDGPVLPLEADGTLGMDTSAEGHDKWVGDGKKGALRHPAATTRRRTRQALTVLDAMIEDGLVPDVYTYSILFSSLGRNGMLAEAVQFYCAAKTGLDNAAINALIGAFSVSPDLPTDANVRATTRSRHKKFALGISISRTVALYDALTYTDREAGITESFVPDKVTYTVILSALARQLKRMGPLDGLKIPRIVFTGTELLDLGWREGSGTPNPNPNPNPNPKAKPGEKEKEWDENVDAVLVRLYHRMRFYYAIEIDSALLAAINGLFYAAASGSTSVIGAKAAELIFDDLYMSGIHPTDCMAVLDACAFSASKRARLIASEVAKRPTSPASYRIFKKHGWNEISSGWTGFF